MELVGTANLGGLLVHSVRESGTFDTNIPTHKTEKGFNITDHIEREPVVIKISGLIVRPTNDRVELAINKLQAMQMKVITYQGRRIYRNMLLHKLNIDTTVKTMNGHEFSCTLTEVYIGESSYVNPQTAVQVKGVTSAGRKQTENKKQSNIYHTMKKGDTYWGLAKKYNTTVAQLEQWNKYDAYKIPTGAKLRVG